jgi:hypothetical protein
VNLEELVREALAEETRAEPDEAGAYDRFLQRRKRSVLRTAASTGLAVTLVLAVAIGAALVVRGGNGGSGGRLGPLASAPTTARAPGSTRAQGPVQTTLAIPTSVPISADRVVRRERQGFELTLPDGWGVDQATTRDYYQRGQPWLVLSPGGTTFTPDDPRRITMFTAVVAPREYPGRRPGDPAPGLMGQSFSPLTGPISTGRRPDGRAYAIGDQGGLLHYAIAWPYRCEPADLCPEAAPFRVIRMEVEGTDGKQGRAMRTLTRNLVDSIRPITNALPPTGAIVEEEPGLFADAPVVVGRGGQGDYAWEMRARKGSGQDYWIETRRQNGELLMGELFGASDRGRLVAWIHCTPSKEQVTATLVSGFGPEAAAKVVLELKGQPPVEVPTFHKQGFPFAFWVVAPLPPDARPLAFTGFDAAGKRLGHGTDFAGYPGGCH